MRRNGYSVREMLDLLVAHNKDLKLNVPTPDFYKSHEYSPQWKVLGSVYYYQLPEAHRGRIIAKYDSDTGDAYFDSYGVKL